MKGQLKFLGENGFDVYGMSADGKEIGDLYENEKIEKHYIINLKRKISPVSDLIAIYQCFRVIRELKPDIVHTYTPKAGLVGMFAAFLAGIQIRLHNVTGLPLMEQRGVKKKILMWAEGLTYALATKVYVNSFGLLDYIKQNISGSGKLSILGSGSTNGIDGGYFKPDEMQKKKAEVLRTKLFAGTKSFVWLFVGRLVNDKGVVELVNSFCTLQKTYRDMQLVLVGSLENEYDSISEDVQETINDHPNIHWVGFENDIRPFLALSDCLVFPSYREGLPNVPMQAACFGLPVIATNINGCNEVIENMKNGILISPKSEEQLVEAMENLFLDKELQLSLSENTRDTVLKKYEQKNVWAHILNEYKIR